MLVSASAGLVSPVMTSRAVTNAVLAELRKSHGRQAQPLPVLSLLRLLDMYEHNNFYSGRHLGILEKDNFSDLNDVDRSDEYARLKAALEKAHADFSRDSSVKEFVERVSSLLAQFADDGKPTVALPEQSVSELEKFLSILSRALTAA